MSEEVRDLGITLEKYEIECIRKILRYFEQLKDFEGLDFYLPKNEEFDSLREIQTILSKEFSTLSSYSRKRKYQKLPLSFLLKLIYTIFITTPVVLSDDCMKKLLELNNRIRNILKSNEDNF